MKMILVEILLVLGTALASGQSERSLIRDGNRLYKDNKYADAEVDYRKALEKNKDMKQGVFNLGDALYKEGRYDEAAEQYRMAATKDNDRVEKAHSLHNLGNSLLRGKKIPESIAAYKEALKINPDDDDTRYNLEYAKALLKQQQQQQKKDQKKDDKQKQDKQKNEQQKQDQQKQDQQKQDQQKQDEQKQKDQNEQRQNQPQQKKQQISKQDAERILEALKNEEKDVQKKLRKKVQARVKVDKNW